MTLRLMEGTPIIQGDDTPDQIIDISYKTFGNADETITLVASKAFAERLKPKEDPPTLKIPFPTDREKILFALKNLDPAFDDDYPNSLKGCIEQARTADYFGASQEKIVKKMERVFQGHHEPVEILLNGLTPETPSFIRDFLATRPGQ